MERTDTERLDWVMDILNLTDAPDSGDAKCLKLGGAILLQKQGREAIDAAMEG